MMLRATLIALAVVIGMAVAPDWLRVIAIVACFVLYLALLAVLFYDGSARA